jgi:hypothetical protein
MRIVFVAFDFETLGLRDGRSRPHFAHAVHVHLQSERGVLALPCLVAASHHAQPAAGPEAHVRAPLLAEIVHGQDGSRRVGVVVFLSPRFLFSRCRCVMSSTQNWLCVGDLQR